jgi:threonylcarbamoyladenosine tRNA methylthiotransferase MtaB
MKRRHSRDDAIRFCAALRARRPEVAFGADLIAGFPTETEAAFRNTMRLVEECGLVHLHVFPYSPRPETPAARMPQVPREVAKARAARLREKGLQALSAHLGKQVGRTVRVLVEEDGVGRAEDYCPVRLPSGPVPGSVVPARIAATDGTILIGETLPVPAAA